MRRSWAVRRGQLFKLHYHHRQRGLRPVHTLAAFHAFLMLLAERRLHGFQPLAPDRPGQRAGAQWIGRWLDLLLRRC
ncbi:hypothetical protein ACU4GD_36365 [Cupriavidus basilensis]